MKKIFLLFTVLLITSACSKKLKETLGISTAGPNEYQVQRAKALEVPPHYYLPDPGNSQPTYNNIKGQDEFNEGEQALMQEIN
ncbi:MAG: DUF3035 domain-containing protein [Rickettsia endosymbiont of Ixodes persulcatus]|nr:DUF3035 domain-containing protein [Rickettsia endosymbiont of Ixodes persulcatus]MCZ6902829.1 DUF3035 domain-containing protein [Rickettsia endosymbiont of Ixodes persulcatus]MCZ6909015.1 DUF3035 domain-containing protein [Rickettsia endosymbiont of Ixodes persulcatus]MCZ6910677.1 DUF3035 domain-containing protein [Rickettsia endosymbiont of Ixodes persulcatus]MCZ6914207.1 DUF3035 domain-containing protein [Rickettsia endosymbiont of Ixodes persulcatus]